MGLFDNVERPNAIAGDSLYGDFGSNNYNKGDPLGLYETEDAPVQEFDYEPKWNLDLADRFEAGVQESFGTLWGGLGMMSDIVGLDSAKEYTMGRSNELFEKAAAHDVVTTSFKEISNPLDLAKFLTEGVIGVIPDIAGTVLGGAGVATGLAKIGGKGIVKKAIQRGAEKKIKALIAKGATKEVAYSTALKELGGMAGVGGYTALQGAGGMYSSDYNMNGDETSPFAALGGGVAQGAITLFNPFSKVLAGIAVKKGVKDIGGMAIGEALEEVSQGGIEQLHKAGIDPDLTVEQIFSDPDTYWQLAEAGVLGAFVGGVFGGIGSKLNSKEEAADFIKKGEEAYPETTVARGPRDIKAMDKESDAFGGMVGEAFITRDDAVRFQQEWDVAEAKLKRTNRAPADNTAIQAAMVRGAEATTPPLTAEVLNDDGDVSSFRREWNITKAKLERTNKAPADNAAIIAEMKKGSTVSDVPPSKPKVKVKKPTPKPKMDKSKVDALIEGYRTPKERLEDDIAKASVKGDTQDSLATQATGMAIQEGVEQTSMSPEEVMIAREGAIEAPVADVDPTSTEPTEGVKHLLGGTPDAAIKYIKSFGNSKKTLFHLREEADDYIKDNPHLEMVIEDNFKEASQAAKTSRGVARDAGTSHKWEPYKVGEMEYGDWLQVDVDGKTLSMVKSPTHGNKFIITEDVNSLTPVEGTTSYKTKQEAKRAFEKLVPSVKGEAKGTKGTEKPLSYTKTGEKDTDGIPSMKAEGKGISRSSDGEYKIVNNHGKHGKFFLYKGDEVLNEGIHFISLGEATAAYKAHRSTDPSALKAKEKKSGKPKVIRRKKGTEVEAAKAKRKAAKDKLTKQEDTTTSKPTTKEDARAAARERARKLSKKRVEAKEKAKKAEEKLAKERAKEQEEAVEAEKKKNFEAILKKQELNKERILADILKKKSIAFTPLTTAEVVRDKVVTKRHIKNADINVSDRSVSSTTITSHPDIDTNHTKLVAGLMNLLGIPYNKMYVGPLGNNRSNHPVGVPRAHMNNANHGVMGRALLDRDTGRLALALRVDRNFDDALLSEIISHEVFHLHQYTVLEAMSEAEKRKVVSIWSDFIRENPPKDVFDNKAARDTWLDTYFSPMIAGKMKDSMGDSLSVTSGAQRTITSFTEWYSNQGAKYVVQNKEGLSLILKTYRSLKDALQRIYTFMTGRNPNTVDPKFKEWMDNIQGAEKSTVVKGGEALTFTDVTYNDVSTDISKDKARAKAKKAKESDYEMTPEDATAYFKKEASKTTKERAKDKIATFIEKAVKKFDDLTLSINERLRKIHPRLRNFMMRYESSILKWNNKNGQDVSPFLKKVLKLDEATQNELGMYLSNTNNKKDHAIAMKMIDDLGLRKEYDKVDGTLEGIYDRAEDVGLNTEEKLDNFFPRIVKDMDGLTNYMLNNPKDAGPLTSIIESKMSEADKATAIQTFMNTNRLPPSMIKKTGSSMKRGIKRINPKMYKFYHSIEDTLQMHIEENNAKIEGRALLGVTNGKKLARVIKSKSSTEAEKIKAKEELFELNSREGESDEDITKFLAKTGLSLNSEDQRLTLSLIRARLNQKGMSGAMGRVRDMGLITALGSPLNTLTQLGDLPLVLYKMGLKDTLAAMKKVGSKKGEITYKQMNLSNVMKEFQTTGTSKWVEKVLDATQFARVDRFFKEVYSQAAISKVRKMDRDVFIKKYEGEYGKEGAAITYDKIKDGDVLNEDVLTFVLGEISEMQPVSLSEMPKGYLEAGNWRILYTLKSYSMKMLATMRREMVDEVKKGNYGQASKNFAMLIPMLVLANAGIDELKDWMQGKEEPFSDNVINNLLKLFLFSKYDMDKIGDKGPSEFLTKLLTPPVMNPIDNMLKDAVNLFPGGDDATYASLAHVPLVGRLAYKKTQEGRTKTKRGTKLSIRDDIRKALKAGDSLNSVRKRIAKYNKNLPVGTKKMPFSVISDIRKDIRRKKIEKARKN